MMDFRDQKRLRSLWAPCPRCPRNLTCHARQHCLLGNPTGTPSQIRHYNELLRKCVLRPNSE